MDCGDMGMYGFYLNSRGAGLTKTGVPKVLREEKPTDIIPVPVRVTPTEKRRPSLFKVRKSSQEIKVKMMTREEYWKHYAKDEQGNYVGTEDPAEDAGVVKGLNWSGKYGTSSLNPPEGFPAEEVIVNGKGKASDGVIR